MMTVAEYRPDLWGRLIVCTGTGETMALAQERQRAAAASNGWLLAGQRPGQRCRLVRVFDEDQARVLRALHERPSTATELVFRLTLQRTTIRSIIERLDSGGALRVVDKRVVPHGEARVWGLRNDVLCSTATDFERSRLFRPDLATKHGRS